MRSFSVLRGKLERVSAKSYPHFSEEASYNWTNAMLSWQRTTSHFQPKKKLDNDPNEESKTNYKICTALCYYKVTGRNRMVLLMRGAVLPSPPPSRALSLSSFQSSHWRLIFLNEAYRHDLIPNSAGINRTPTARMA
ncbi:hypothetical protein ACFX15_028689 [Malus domestica]